MFESMWETCWSVSGYLGLAYLPMALVFAGYAAWSMKRIVQLEKMNTQLCVRLHEAQPVSE